MTDSELGMILLSSDGSYKALLEFLHGGIIPEEPEALTGKCRMLSESVYSRISELKRLQRRLTELQLANSVVREAWVPQLIQYLKRKMAGKNLPVDEIQELSRRVNDEQKQLQQIVEPMEMSDDFFQEYLPCGDQYVRVLPDALIGAAQEFFERSFRTDSGDALNRFMSVQDIFGDFPPDQRIFALAALLSTMEDFDKEEFRSWDTRLLRMLYGAEATPQHPLTYDRFLVHAVLYGLPSGTIEDRFIGFRIGWELFRRGWSKHFEHQLRALVSTAYLLRNKEPFPTGEEDFKGFYEQKLRRYRALMRSIHHRSKAPDQQMGRGMGAGGSNEASIGASEMGGSGTGSVFDGISAGGGSRIGIPDPIFVASSRLVGVPATVGIIYQHLSEMLQAFSKLNAPMQIASILADTPLYFMDRRDKRDSFQPDEPGAFASQLRERTRTVSRLGADLGLKGLHAALIALQPGSVDDSIEAISGIFHQMKYVPESARRMVSFLLMDGMTPLIRHRRFAYEIWFAEGLG